MSKMTNWLSALRKVEDAKPLGFNFDPKENHGSHNILARGYLTNTGQAKLHFRPLQGEGIADIVIVLHPTDAIALADWLRAIYCDEVD